MYKRLSVYQLGIAVVILVMTGSSVFGVTTDSLVQVSGPSPFGPLANCGNFPGIFEGVNFVNSEVEPWVEVNPVNPDNIVAIWQQDRWSDGGSRGNVAGVSNDGGASWTSVPIPGITDCTGGPWERASDPWVSFSPDGTLHQMSLVFQTNPPADRIGGFGPNGMAVSKSSDGGLTWSDPIMLIEDDDPRVLNDKNSLTADPTDANFVYAVWDRLQITAADAINPENVRPGRGIAIGVRIGFGFKGPIYFARSTNGGDSWEPVRKIYDPGANNQTIGNQIVVLPDGTLVDFFTEILNFKNNDQNGLGFNFNLALFKSNNKGDTWLPKNKPIRAARIFSNGAVTPDDMVPVRDASILFDVAVDPVNGSIYAVWQDTRFSGFEEVAFSMSTDGGYTWSTPIKVNQTPPNADHPLRTQAFLPSIAAADDGALSVTYYDFRNDNESGELADYFAVVCSDNCSDPSSWGNEVRLTDSSFDYLNAPYAGGLFLGDYEGLASDGFDFVPVFGIAVDSSDPASIFFRRVSP
jgi:hypothetical protein